MTGALVDAGPLIALLDRRERRHADVVAWFEDHEGALATTWPVVTELFHMVGRTDLKDGALRMIERGFAQIVESAADDAAELRRYLETYKQLKPDLADLSLLVAADKLGYGTVLTFDSDFLVYRTRGGRALNCPLLPN